MRADRLIATLLVLQRRGRVTARELADELEVSVATARRDLEALGAAGIPVYPQAGRGGGWSLLGGARTDLSGLSATEAQALFRLAGPAATASPEAKAALRKLVQALPETFRAEAEATAAATVIDPTRWGERGRAKRPALVDQLERAVVERTTVQIAYTSGSRRRSDRAVDPWGLVAKDDTWHLIAGTDEGRRTFRVDRIEAATVTDTTFEPPADLDLAEAWESVVAVAEERRSQTTATVLVDERFVFVLRDHFGRHCEVVGTGDDGRAEVRVSAPTPLDVARTLAGWGGAVQVVGPGAVQDQLGRIGRELAAAYP